MVEGFFPLGFHLAGESLGCSVRLMLEVRSASEVSLIIFPRIALGETQDDEAFASSAGSRRRLAFRGNLGIVDACASLDCLIFCMKLAMLSSSYVLAISSGEGIELVAL